MRGHGSITKQNGICFQVSQHRRHFQKLKLKHYFTCFIRLNSFIVGRKENEFAEFGAEENSIDED